MCIYCCESLFDNLLVVFFFYVYTRVVNQHINPAIYAFHLIYKIANFALV
jgi:hypothetical protein